VGDEPISTPGRGEALLTVGVAEAMGVSVGDRIVLRNADMQTLELTVSGIYDNYVFNYAIVNPDTVYEQWGAYAGEQMAMVKVAGHQDVHEVSARISNMSNVMSVSVSVDTAEMVGSMMDALDLVVVVIVFAAGALAVIVLYNLTNINITERIREIATIKVLGFTASETGAYVFKENLLLTFAGVLLGIPMGWWFLDFVIERVKINMVWFQPKATLFSYLISAAITVVSALIVDWIFYYKLDKINMAEALKSVE
jgi:putative ABC transport system permease protein